MAVNLKTMMEQVAQDIDRLFAEQLPVPEDPRRRLVEAMRYAAIGGGKRLRPLLVVATCALFNVDREAALRVGMAIECIHVYSLIHDDMPCMDNDDLRRGKPTVHKAFDDASAVLSGDALQALAFEILSEEKIHTDPHVRLELIQALAIASGKDGMVGGQAIDLAAETSTVPFDLPTITRLQQLKTGALFGFCLEAGAIMGRQNKDIRDRLKAYARDIGLAFQIADDLIDAEGDEAVAGKAVGKDAAAGKATFLSLLGLEKARSQAQALVDQAIAHLSVFGSEADYLRSIARYIVPRDH